jgi:hypothetical protein
VPDEIICTLKSIENSESGSLTSYDFSDSTKVVITRFSGSNSTDIFIEKKSENHLYHYLGSGQEADYHFLPDYNYSIEVFNGEPFDSIAYLKENNRVHTIRQHEFNGETFDLYREHRLFYNGLGQLEKFETYFAGTINGENLYNLGLIVDILEFDNVDHYFTPLKSWILAPDPIVLYSKYNPLKIKETYFRQDGSIESEEEIDFTIEYDEERVTKYDNLVLDYECK